MQTVISPLHALFPIFLKFPNLSLLKIKSPFLNNKLIDEIEWTNRLQYLENTIHNCIETGLSSDAKNTYSIQYLFYNE